MFVLAHLTPLTPAADPPCQDLGNTNFSIHMSRETFDRNLVTALVCRAVRSFGVDARVNERNDILVGLHKMSPLLTTLPPQALTT
jgi:hypothetical protein